MSSIGNFDFSRLTLLGWWITPELIELCLQMRDLVVEVQDEAFMMHRKNRRLRPHEYTDFIDIALRLVRS